MFRTKKSVMVLVVLVVVAALLAACGGDKKSSSSSSVDLKQNYDSPTGVSVKYPDGWVAKDASGGVYVASSQDAMDTMEATDSQGPGKGQAGVMLMAMPGDALGGMSPADAFKAMAPSLASESTTASDVKDTKVNGQAAFRIDITDANGEGFMLGWDKNGSLVIAAGVAAPGELKNHESTLLKIIDSVTYTAPAAG